MFVLLNLINKKKKYSQYIFPKIVNLKRKYENHLNMYLKGIK